MTPSEKITELKALLAEAKEALMNRDPHTREKECYDSGHTPCECTLCKINAVLKPEEVPVTIKDLAIKHRYYASPASYNNNEPSEFETWQDFIDECGDDDIDMNLVYRWDIKLVDEEDDDETQGYKLQITFIRQRKGIYAPVHIKLVEDRDAPSIVAFLMKHAAVLNEIWTPINL